jgi:hypothetical protein
MSTLKNSTSDKYVKAFISVCEMIEGDAVFNDIIHTTHITEEGVEKELIISGVCGENIIQVTTEVVEGKGLNIVVRYYNEFLEKVKERYIWYYSFNWKGLIATA